MRPNGRKQVAAAGLSGRLAWLMNCLFGLFRTSNGRRKRGAGGQSDLLQARPASYIAATSLACIDDAAAMIYSTNSCLASLKSFGGPIGYKWSPSVNDRPADFQTFQRS